MWGAGCIMAELWKRNPILQGSTEQQQIILISQLCGSIEPSVWINVEKLDLYSKLNLPKGLKRKVTEDMKQYVTDQYALDLLECLLTLDPSNRMDSDEALNHDFFWTEPLPAPLNLCKHSKNMYELTALPRRNQAAQAQNKSIINQQHFDRVY